MINDSDHTPGVETPDAASEAVIIGMRRRATDRGFWTPKLKYANLNALRLCNPHRVAFVPLDRIPRKFDPMAATTILRAATQILGWRFLIYDEEQPIAAARALLFESGEYRLTELNEGPFVEGTAEAFRVARKRLPSFEPLFLNVPALCVAALWMRERKGNEDRFLEMDRSKPFHIEKQGSGKFLTHLADLATKVNIDSLSEG